MSPCNPQNTGSKLYKCWHRHDKKEVENSSTTVKSNKKINYSNTYSMLHMVRYMHVVIENETYVVI